MGKQTEFHYKRPGLALFSGSTAWQGLFALYLIHFQENISIMKFSKFGLPVALLASSASAASLQLEQAKRERAQSPTIPKQLSNIRVFHRRTGGQLSSSHPWYTKYWIALLLFGTHHQTRHIDQLCRRTGRDCHGIHDTYHQYDIDLNHGYGDYVCPRSLLFILIRL